MLLLQLLALLLLSDTASARDLRVGAFNIQVFGVTKSKKPEVMDILVKIIRRYDLLLIQEIRDSSKKAIHILLAQVNQGQSEPFEMVISERLGSTSSKEQYAYLYRPAAGLQVHDKYTYPDTKNKGVIKDDLFERPPYVVAFSSSKTELDAFGLIGIHVDPDKAVNEINYLHKYVVKDVKVTLKQPDLMILGDLNADCNYVSKKKWKTIPMKIDPHFNWLIGDEIDTTVKGSHCAYDRFISTGLGWDKGIVKDSAKVYRFDQDPNYIGQVDYTLATAVSDHYPIEFLLKERQKDIPPHVSSDSILISIWNRVYIKLGGAYKENGRLPLYEFFDIGVKSKTVHVLSVYDEQRNVVGELNKEKENIEEQLLTEVLLRLIRDASNMKIFIQPIKKRYSGKQKSKLVLALPATDGHQATVVWNILLKDVCELTYFKCSNNNNFL